MSSIVHHNMRQVNLPEDIECPKDIFFTHPIVETVAATASTKKTITRKKKSTETPYQELFNGIQETTNDIIKCGGKGYFWIVTSLELLKLIERDNKEFVSAPFEQLPLGYNYVMWIGVLERRWRVYVDPLLTINKLVIGATFSKKSPAFYGVIEIN
jgi:hypothetical protein